jgi:hypothetical protein
LKYFLLRRVFLVDLIEWFTVLYAATTGIATLSWASSQWPRAAARFYTDAAVTANKMIRRGQVSWTVPLGFPFQMRPVGSPIVVKTGVGPDFDPGRSERPLT